MSIDPNILLFAFKLALLTSFLGAKMKGYFTLNEASRDNLNADKRILTCQPFLHKVYYYPEVSQQRHYQNLKLWYMAYKI